MKKNKSNGEAKRFPSFLKAVVFDLDGTLMNTLVQISGIGNNTLETFGYDPLPVDNYRYYLGNGASALLESIFNDVKIDDPKIQEEFSAYYMESYAKSRVGKELVYPGIYELIEALRERKIKLGVLTNKPHEITIRLIEDVFPHMFDGILGQKEEIKRKPDPEGFNLLADSMGFTADSVVYMGDTNTDMMTGNNYGAYTFGVLWGFRDRQELEESGAHGILKYPTDLLDYLK